MVELFANSGYPDQTSRSAASDLGLHCLPITLLGVSRLQCAINATLISMFIRAFRSGSLQFVCTILLSLLFERICCFSSASSSNI